MKIFRVTAVTMVLIISTSANAALVERLGGLAYYDDVADLTWLADANAAGTAMNWEDANSWAAELTVGGVDGWRLPDTFNNCTEYYCTTSEFGNLFYNVLGNEGHDVAYPGPFSNVQTIGYQSTSYWSATEADVPYYETGSTSQYAWGFNMYGGDQYEIVTHELGFAWAVQPGDVSAVPVPAAVWLFGSGLIVLAGFARRKKA